MVKGEQEYKKVRPSPYSKPTTSNKNATPKSSFLTNLRNFVTPMANLLKLTTPEKENLKEEENLTFNDTEKDASFTVSDSVDAEAITPELTNASSSSNVEKKMTSESNDTQFVGNVSPQDAKAFLKKYFEKRNQDEESKKCLAMLDVFSSSKCNNKRFPTSYQTLLGNNKEGDFQPLFYPISSFPTKKETINRPRLRKKATSNNGKYLTTLEKRHMELKQRKRKKIDYNLNFNINKTIIPPSASKKMKEIDIGANASLIPSTPLKQTIKSNTPSSAKTLTKILDQCQVENNFSVNDSVFKKPFDIPFNQQKKMKLQSPQDQNFQLPNTPVSNTSVANLQSQSSQFIIEKLPSSIPSKKIIEEKALEIQENVERVVSEYRKREKIFDSNNSKRYRIEKEDEIIDSNSSFASLEEAAEKAKKLHKNDLPVFKFKIYNEKDELVDYLNENFKIVNGSIGNTAEKFEFKKKFFSNNCSFLDLIEYEKKHEEVLKTSNDPKMVNPRPVTNVEISSTQNPFAAFMNKSGWTCPLCAITNKESDLKCAACEEAKPGSKPEEAKNSTTSNFTFGGIASNPQLSETSKANVCGSPTKNKKFQTTTQPETSSFTTLMNTPTSDTNPFAAFLKKDGWTCSTCLINNKNSDLKCLSCEADKPGTVERVTPLENLASKESKALAKVDDKGAPSQMFTFGKSADSNLSGKVAPHENPFASFLSKTGWTCPTCLVKNKESDVKCPACEEKKPGIEASDATPVLVSQSVPTASKVEDAKSITKFTFGKPAAVQESGSLQPTSKLSFGSSPSTQVLESSQSAAKFTFGNSPASGFSFATNVTQTTSITPSATQAVKPATSSFTFVQQSTAPTKFTSFQSPSTSAQPTSSFSFGQITATPVSEVTKSAFGEHPITAVPEVAPTTSLPTPLTAFGESPNNTVSEVAQTGSKLTFGQQPATTVQPSSSFTFGQPPTATVQPSSNFTFGPLIPTQASQPTSNITFGQSNPTTTVQPTSNFTFSQPNLTQAAQTNSNITFGQANTTTTVQPTSTFTFSQPNATQAAQPTSNFTFGETATATVQPNFTFGQPNPAQAAQTNSNITFGQQAGPSAGSSFGFGVTAIPKPNESGFTFGGK
ncbi:hypothetical protein HDU92_005442 [Lobulomyces angularis]|nr:hypothetical protein HDU92_005442 [Lobulomyces angularis]